MDYTNKKGEKYFLHATVVTLRGGHNRKQKIHYFGKTPNKERLVNEVPAGFHIVENLKTGLLCLKRN